MTDSDWAVCAATLEAWPGDFPPRSAEAYRRMLEGLTVEETLEALRRYTRQGQRWRPSPGEIVALAGRAVSLPPFGALRQALTRACLTTPVRLARMAVDEAICDQLSDGLAQMFVIAVGGERIRRVVLYMPDEQVERAWESLARDYAAMSAQLTDQAFLGLGPDGGARGALGPGRV